MPVLYRHKWIYLESKADVSMLQGRPQLFITQEGPILEESACVLNVAGRVEFRVCPVTRIRQVTDKKHFHGISHQYIMYRHMQ